ncbi:MAG: hypothetical protein IPN79_17480 [Saprospiraceae bacterium]|nr:hypothetical protein [Saprospiraceae bacterium]
MIGPELMFAHQMDVYYEDPVLIIKTAWGGKALQEDFRPPSATGNTECTTKTTIRRVRDDRNCEVNFLIWLQRKLRFPGFVWFQGWNDGATDDFLNEYESNLFHLV